jgi:hypothetical protein
MRGHRGWLALSVLMAVLCSSTGICQEAAGDPTEKECVELGERISASLAKGDGSVMNAAIDTEAIYKKASEGLTVDAEIKKGFLMGWGKHALGTTVAQTIRGDASAYRLLRYHVQDGKPRLLYRMLTGEGGVNYHDLFIGRDKDGKPCIVDIYIFMSGENLTVSFRRGLLLAVTSQPGFLDRLVGWESDFAKNINNIQQMQKLAQTGQAAEALKVFAALPASLRKHKNFLILRLMCAQRAGEVEYATALADIEKAFPNDPGLDLLRLDGCFMSRQYDEGLKALDRLEKSIGEDSYIHFQRGAFCVAKEDLPKAKEWYRKAVAAEPTLAAPYWGLANLLVKEKDFAGLARTFTDLEKNAGEEIGDLENEELYAEFVKSKEYQEWMKARPTPEAKKAGAAAKAAPAPQKVEAKEEGAPGAKVTKILRLKDGSEIRAVTYMETADGYIVKDAAGKMRTLSKKDVEEARDP